MPEITEYINTLTNTLQEERMRVQMLSDQLNRYSDREEVLKEKLRLFRRDLKHMIEDVRSIDTIRKFLSVNLQPDAIFHYTPINKALSDKNAATYKYVKSPGNLGHNRKY